MLLIGLLSSTEVFAMVSFDGYDTEDFYDEMFSARGQPRPGARLLQQRIAESCQYIVREVGDPLPAEVTLTQRKGSCRDLTVLFMEACRALGIAARFLSGYHVPLTDQIHRLHAWAEVYLPGGGWRGYDPTAGLAVGDPHIVVAAGSTPRMAAPISGSFRGENITATLEVEIQLRPADGDTFSPLAL
jgi:transglutaminase-like putative cysteine protease